MKKLLAVTALSLAALSAQAKDIVDTAVGAGKFNTLVAALARLIWRMCSSAPAMWPGRRWPG